MNSWCAIAPLHKDPTKVTKPSNVFMHTRVLKSNKENVSHFQEPFIDVAVGGNQMPGATSGSLVVWAVTAHGRVLLLIKFFYVGDTKFNLIFSIL